MERKDLIHQLSEIERSLRQEAGFSQEQMAKVLGISKKSLVQTEMGRRNLQWTECVTLAVTFSGSRLLQETYGGELSDMIRAVAFADTGVSYPKTMGGKVWWTDLNEKNGYRIQQNLISRHYRVLDPDDGRMISSFDAEEIKAFFDAIDTDGE